jgi:hypothetical protein
LEVTSGECVLPAAFGELLLIVKEMCRVDRDSTLTTLRYAARFHDSAGFTVLARTVRCVDFESLRRRLGLLTADEPGAGDCDPAE